MNLPFSQSDAQNHAFVTSGSASVRQAREPDEMLVVAASRLLERVDLPRTVKRELYALRSESRRVAVNRSGFAAVMRAAQYATNAADALWLPRLIEAELYGRCSFPTMASDTAHKCESESNGAFDFAQITHRERRSQSTLDELWWYGLLQETMTKAVMMSDANELRVRAVYDMSKR